MWRLIPLLVLLAAIVALALPAQADRSAVRTHAPVTLTIATVNNSDMIIMQKLSPKFEQATGIKLDWVVLEENAQCQLANHRPGNRCRIEIDIVRLIAVW